MGMLQGGQGVQVGVGWGARVATGAWGHVPAGGVGMAGNAG